MAFDIEKMKADGVSSHLIELASMNQETFLLLIARRLEHDKLFQQFMVTEVGEIEEMYSYAVAAGLMSESDREWLLDEGNPYKDTNTYTINYSQGENSDCENTDMPSATNVRINDKVPVPPCTITECETIPSKTMVVGGIEAPIEHISDTGEDLWTFTEEMAATAVDGIVSAVYTVQC